MERYVHGVAMVEAPAFVNGSLPKNCNRKRFLVCFEEEALHFPGIRQNPRGRTVEANHGRSAYHATLWNRPDLRESPFGFSFKQRIGNLAISGCHAPVYFGDLIFRFRNRAFTSLKVFSRYQP